MNSDNFNNLSEIKAFGETFKFSKARDFEVILNKDGWINYSKLLESITGKRTALRDLCKNNSGFLDIIKSFDAEKMVKYAKSLAKEDENISVEKSDKSSLNQTTSGSVELKSSTEDFSIWLRAGTTLRKRQLPKTLTVDALIKAGIMKKYQGGTHREIWGTYGPKYMIDF